MTPDQIRTTPIIGLTGAAGSGKSTAANWLLVNHKNAMKFSFAKPIKVMVYELLRATMPAKWPVGAKDYLDDPILKETPIPFLNNVTARYLMQTLGTEWGRHTVHPDFWVMIARGKVERLMGDPRHKGADMILKCMFDDLRFANEAAMVRSFGGAVVRIERPDSSKPPSISAHASEQQLLSPDVVVVNDGTVADLHEKLALLWPPTVKPKA